MGTEQDQDHARVDEATELLVRPEAPTPMGADLKLTFRNTVVAAAVTIVSSQTKYLDMLWLLCDARLIHEDGVPHEVHWKSRTLPMAMQFVQALTQNYPGIRSMSVKVEL